MTKITVLEVDQLTASGLVRRLNELTMTNVIDMIHAGEITEGDAKAALDLGLVEAQIREVDENSSPPSLHVWFTAGPDGKLMRFRDGYLDSSG